MFHFDTFHIWTSHELEEESHGVDLILALVEVGKFFVPHQAKINVSASIFFLHPQQTSNEFRTDVK